MSPTKLGAFASLALAANAFLIPSTTSAADLGDDNALETIAVNHFVRSVALECPRCDFATVQGGKLAWKSGVGNAFLIDFDVGPNEDMLAVNGTQLFPPSFNYFMQPFHVAQVDPSSEENLSLRVTGYKFHFNSAETISEAGTELLPMTFRITSVEGRSVNPPALTINLLKDTEGRLMIASFQTAQAASTDLADEEKDCNEWPLYCKWRNILGNHIDKLKGAGKGCHGPPHPEGRPNPMAEDSIEGKPPHRFRPGRPHHDGPHRDGPHHGRPHHPDHGGHRHGGHHHFHIFFRRAFFTILIPILIGIFAGTLTYLVGMALGCLIAIVVARFRGQSYQRVALVEEEEEQEAMEEGEGDDEKVELADVLAYGAPPGYEEVAEKEVCEGK